MIGLEQRQGGVATTRIELVSVIGRIITRRLDPSVIEHILSFKKYDYSSHLSNTKFQSYYTQSKEDLKSVDEKISTDKGRTLWCRDYYPLWPVSVYLTP